MLGQDPSLSLRHLMVITHPLHDHHEVRFRFAELRTQAAFIDERDKRLHALEAEGPLFIRCGRYALFFLVTGDEIPWPWAPSSTSPCRPSWRCTWARPWTSRPRWAAATPTTGGSWRGWAPWCRASCSR